MRSGRPGGTKNGVVREPWGESPLCGRAQQFELAAALVEQKLGDPELTLEWVANQLGLPMAPATRLHRAGRQARALLEDEKLYAKALYVREVSRTVGYYQPAGFAKAFRWHFGMAPREVRPRRPRREGLGYASTKAS